VCGERRRDPRDLALHGLVRHAIESITSIDGKVLRSFRTLIARPGALTVAFLEGRRKPYLNPVAVFLVANVLFFAAESVTRGLVFTTPLQSHMYQQPWEALTRALVERRLASRHLTLAAYAPIFDAAIAPHAHSLILLMVAAFAPLPALVFRRSRLPFAAHAVFSLHLYAFMLLLFSIGTAIPAVPIVFGGVRSPSQTLDAVLSISLLVAGGIYLFTSARVVYGSRGARRVLGTVALTIGMAAIVLAYRFALMLITLYST
jgi:hypothetical protein